jgi:hypothetical protein
LYCVVIVCLLETKPSPLEEEEEEEEETTTPSDKVDLG